MAKTLDDTDFKLNNNQELNRTFEELKSIVMRFVQGRSLKVNFNEAAEKSEARAAEGKKTGFFY